MKKKYCAPLIREVVFRAEEAVGACIIYTHLTIRGWVDDYLTVTEEDDASDNWMLYNGRWARKDPTLWNLDLLSTIRVPNHRPYVYEDDIAPQERPNHS